MSTENVTELNGAVLLAASMAVEEVTLAHVMGFHYEADEESEPHTPTEFERELILDAVHMLITKPEFMIVFWPVAGCAQRARELGITN